MGGREREEKRQALRERYGKTLQLFHWSWGEDGEENDEVERRSGKEQVLDMEQVELVEQETVCDVVPGKYVVFGNGNVKHLDDAPRVRGIELVAQVGNNGGERFVLSMDGSLYDGGVKMVKQDIIKIECTGTVPYVLTAKGQVFALSRIRPDDGTGYEQVQGDLANVAVVDIAAGSKHCLGLSMFGQVYGWEVGSPSARLIEVETVQGISSGGLHSGLVAKSGALYICDAKSMTPTRSKYTHKVVQAVCGKGSVVVLLESGVVEVLELKSMKTKAILDGCVRLFGGDSMGAALVLQAQEGMTENEFVDTLEVLLEDTWRMRARLPSIAGIDRNEISTLTTTGRELGGDLMIDIIYQLRLKLMETLESLQVMCLSYLSNKGNSKLGMFDLDVFWPVLHDCGDLLRESPTEFSFVVDTLDEIGTRLVSLADKQHTDDQLRLYSLTLLLGNAFGLGQREMMHNGLVINQAAAAIFSLPRPNRKRLLDWINQEVSPAMFEQALVSPLKRYLKNPEKFCGHSLKLLDRLYQINCSRERRPGMAAIPRSAFESSTLSDLPDDTYRHFLMRWKQDLAQHRGSKRKKKSDLPDVTIATFMKHTFLFDVETKSKFLDAETDILRIMSAQHAQNTGTDPHFHMNVRREHLVEDSIRNIEGANAEELKKPLVVRFEEELGDDEGGVKKEFFQVLSGELFNRTFRPLPKSVNKDRPLWFGPPENVKAWANELKNVGLLTALAIYNKTILDVSFPLLFYRILLRQMPRKPTLELLEEELDPRLAHGLQNMLRYAKDPKLPEEEFQEMFPFTFEVPLYPWGTDSGGSNVMHPLEEGGSNIQVTKKNCKEYVSKYVSFLCGKGGGWLQDGVHHFTSGFRMLFSEDFTALRIFEPRDFELIITGDHDFDLSLLRPHTEYEGQFHENHGTVLAFWDIVLKEFNTEQQGQLLRFVTGSSKAPVGGLANVPFTIQRAGPDTENLPTASTCFNILLLPEYSSKHKLRKKLLLALENAQGFGLH